MTSPQQRLEGVIAAAVSPRRPPESSIDLGVMLDLIDFLCDKGIHGIALLGSTGEFVHFDTEDRRHMVHLAAKRSRVPLLVNVSHSLLDGAVGLARDAASAGVAGVLLMPPYYFRYDGESVRAFYLAFARQLGDSVPIFLYNIPSCTNEIPSAVACELLAGGQFAGIKDSSGSVEYFDSLREAAARTPFTILSGSERIYVRSRLFGAHGAVSGIASAVPELMVALERSICGGDTERTHRIEALVLEFIARIEAFPMPVGIKEALKQRKLDVGGMASPLGPDGDRRLAQFGAWFREWLPGALRDCAT